MGAAVRRGDAVAVNVFSGASVLDPGEPTGREAVIARVLAPLAQHEVGTIRCIGLNVSRSPGAGAWTRTGCMDRNMCVLC